ncbi:MAG: DMT family transporter, partial [Candidatus Aminicenantes bacterium]|nr:DMT family transporter [Candidatus Aminicenantes bacterium]
MASSTDRSPALGLSDGLMLAVVVLWSLNFSLVKIGLRELAPAGFNGLRLLVTAVAFLGLLALSRRKFRGLLPSDLGKLALIGVMGNAVYQMLFIGAMSRTTASNTSFILSTSPVFVALLSLVLRIEKISWTGWLGIFTSLAGLYLVISRMNGGFNPGSASFRGDAMIFAGTILWAGYTVFSKPFLERLSPLQFSALTMAFGAAAYLPLTFRDIVRIPWAEVSWRAWGALLVSALFGLVLGYLVWYYSVQRV